MSSTRDADARDEIGAVVLRTTVSQCKGQSKLATPGFRNAVLVSPSPDKSGGFQSTQGWKDRAIAHLPSKSGRVRVPQEKEEEPRL
jgi:hypothetical protein